MFRVSSRPWNAVSSLFSLLLYSFLPRFVPGWLSMPSAQDAHFSCLLHFFSVCHLCRFNSHFARVPYDLPHFLLLLFFPPRSHVFVLISLPGFPARAAAAAFSRCANFVPSSNSFSQMLNKQFLTNAF
jgi:hypothetical protein